MTSVTVTTIEKHKIHNVESKRMAVIHTWIRLTASALAVGINDESCTD